MKRLVFTGPESTGKTTLSKLSADTFGGHYVPEAARSWMHQIDRDYNYEDILHIAKLQIGLENKAKNSPTGLIFHDTDLLTIRIWTLVKYGKSENWIDDYIYRNLPDLYFLCGIDCPWEMDPQREHPDQRQMLFDMYQRELDLLDSQYIILEGSIQQRLTLIQNALSAIGFIE